MNEELRRLVEENIALDNRIKELNGLIERNLASIDKIDIDIIRKRLNDTALMEGQNV